MDISYNFSELLAVVGMAVGLTSIAVAVIRKTYLLRTAGTYPNFLKNTRTTFLYSLFLAMLFVLSGFNFTTRFQPVSEEVYDMPFVYDEVDIIPRTAIRKSTPPPPPPPKLVEVFNTEILEEVAEYVDEPDTEYIPDEVVVDGSPSEDLTIPEPVAPPLPPAPVENTEPEIYTRAEFMPRFPGCETMNGTEKEKESCAQKKMLEYIYEKLRYPVIAKENGVEGMAVIRFEVDEAGNIVNQRVVKNPGAGTGEAALKAVRSMNEMDEKWTPGRQGGRRVRVQYTLPVRFRLED